MRKLLTLILSFLSLIAIAQKTKIVMSEIDSISQQRWNATVFDLDSLADPKYEKFVVNFKDTIVILNRIDVVKISDEIPVTPYNLLQLKDVIKWFYHGQNSIVFNQSSFSNWNAGGNSNIGIIGKINYNLSYKNRKHFLDNNIQLGYGFVSTEGEASRKTEDYINLMTNYGYDIGRNFYLSTGFQFLSQFSAGYNYSLTPDPSLEDRISRFMSPGYVYAGVGVLYNPNENYKQNPIVCFRCFTIRLWNIKKR